jgi:hypothetical protein
MTSDWFKEEYYSCLRFATNAVKNGDITQSSLQEVRNRFPSRFDYDHIFIDEGQDWHEAERDFLYAVYGSENLLIALGKDQLTRRRAPCKWDAPEARAYTIRLRRCLRLTPNLASFANFIAEELGLGDRRRQDNCA